MTLSVFSDTIDCVKESAALCILKLMRTKPGYIEDAENIGRFVHLLEDKQMVRHYHYQLSLVINDCGFSMRKLVFVHF